MIILSMVCILNSLAMIYIVYRSHYGSSSAAEVKQMKADVQKVTLSVQSCRYEIAEDRVNSFDQFKKLFDLHRDLKITVRELYEKIYEEEDIEWLAKHESQLKRVQLGKQRAVK